MYSYLRDGTLAHACALWSIPLLKAILLGLPARDACVGRVRSPSGPGTRKPHVANGGRPRRCRHRTKRIGTKGRKDHEEMCRVELDCQKIGP